MILGVFVIGYDYLMSKKDKVYEKMSYELSNIPDLIETEEIVPDSELSDNDNLIEEIEELFLLTKHLNTRNTIFISYCVAIFHQPCYNIVEVI